MLRINRSRLFFEFFSYRLNVCGDVPAQDISLVECVGQRRIDGV